MIPSSKPEIKQPAPAQPAYLPPVQKPSRSGITGFRDISSNEEPQPKDKKDMAWYTGGASSGISVQAPQNSQPQDVVNNLFENAKRHGAIAKHDEKAPEKEKFGGSGFVLGQTDKQSTVVPAAPPKQLPKRVVLTFYKDCFTVDDGPPRKLADPANKAFIDDINNGRVPRELATNVDVDVELIDKKGEDYKPPPKPAMVSFSGAGHTLGGPQTNGMASTTAKKLIVDDSAPTTTVQVRTHNGQRLIIKANQTHTVGDLRAHIALECPAGGKSFELRTTFPSQALTDDTLTLKDAGLLNAAIVQRI